MKNSKRTFVRTEIILAVMILIVCGFMFMERRETDTETNRVAVVIGNSEDRQWASFRYGLEMSAKDKNVQLTVAGTGQLVTYEEQKELIQIAIDNGADAVITQLVTDEAESEFLEEIQSHVPLILVKNAGCSETEKCNTTIIKADNYGMGRHLVQELSQDCGKDLLKGKKIGILSENGITQTTLERLKGVRESVEEAGADISWVVSQSFSEQNLEMLKHQPKVDFLLTLDDISTRSAGKAFRQKLLNGVVVYGIGHSTESIYCLDKGEIKCLVVPDEFSIGYQSLEEVYKQLQRVPKSMESKEVSYFVLHQDNLFSEENEQLIYTMSQ